MAESTGDPSAVSYSMSSSDDDDSDHDPVVENDRDKW